MNMEKWAKALKTNFELHFQTSLKYNASHSIRDHIKSAKVYVKEDEYISSQQNCAHMFIP